jgi:alkylation response protein AidB-like acyl-CoA dehydrogenase
MSYPKTERQQAFMALADRLAEQIAARAAEHDRENTFPFEAFGALHAGGYLALTVPREYGGQGADPLEVSLAQERLARGDGSVALGVTMHLGLIARLATTRTWPEELFARLCREVVEEGALINSAASEPELGSPSRGGLPSTTAVRSDGGWRLNGRKRWTSLAPALRYATVMATVEDDGEPPRRANFLVPMAAPGLRVEPNWDNLGMRATGSHDVVLEDVLVPDEARLPGEDAPGIGDPRGWGLITCAVYTGIAAAARDFAVDYARGRRPGGQSGRSIAEYQTVQHRVAEMDLLLLQTRAVVYGTAETWVERPDQQAAIAWQLAAAKYLSTNNAIRVTDLALRVVGSAGLSRAAPLERYFRDVRAGLGHPPIDDAALTLIGKAALGL